MTDQDFQDKVFDALSGIESRLEKRIDSMDTRLEKRLDSMESQRKENNDRLEKRLDSMESHVAQLKHDVGWVKGKLEGKQEGSGRMLTIFTTSAAITAVIIALIALFN